MDVDEKNSGAMNSSAARFSGVCTGREKLGGLTASLGATGGYATLDSRRSVVDVDAGLNRETESDWSGGLFTIHGGLSYQADLGSVFVRPQATLDYIWFKEADPTESGGGEAIDLDRRPHISKRRFVGATLDMRSLWRRDGWKKELTRVAPGFRQGPANHSQLIGAASSKRNSMSSKRRGVGGRVPRLGQIFGTRLEGGGEFRDDYDAYDGGSMRGEFWPAFRLAWSGRACPPRLTSRSVRGFRRR